MSYGTYTGHDRGLQFPHFDAGISDHESANEHHHGDSFVDSTPKAASIRSHGLSSDLTSGQVYCLYISHFLSMWNSRAYEFCAILFIQAAFPGNLTASSINGIAETACVLLFSSALGRRVDRTTSRLKMLLTTIIANRCTVITSCIFWSFIITSRDRTRKNVLFAIVLLLNMGEKLSRMTNLLSMERDWIPTLAPPSLEESPWTPFGLTRLNAGMKRIDLLCKLLAPLAISTLMSAITPVKVAAGVVIMSLLSWGIECWCVQKVWAQNYRLRQPKETGDNDLRGLLIRNGSESTIAYDNSESTADEAEVPARVRIVWLWLRERLEVVKVSVLDHAGGLRCYFATDVWIPSIAMAILHASVLSYSSTLIVYLLNEGFSLNLITVARAVGSLFEISSTFIFPYGISALSKAPTASHTVEESQLLLGGGRGLEERGEGKSQAVHDLGVGVMRLGLWSICGLFLTLIPVILTLWHLELSLRASTLPLLPRVTESISPLKYHPFATVTLFSFLSFAQLGRWIYNLTTQQLTQTRVPAPQRASFGGTEMSVVSLVSLVHWISATVWHAQSDFKWLALGSFIAVGGSAGMYVTWVRRR